MGVDRTAPFTKSLSRRQSGRISSDAPARLIRCPVPQAERTSSTGADCSLGATSGTTAGVYLIDKGTLGAVAEKTVAPPAAPVQSTPTRFGRWRS